MLSIFRCCSANPVKVDIEKSIQALEQEFRSSRHSSETNTILVQGHTLLRSLLQRKDLQDEQMQIEYEKILVGTAILAAALESDKYCSKGENRYYPLRASQLEERCQLITKFYTLPLGQSLPQTVANTHIQNLIVGIGYRALIEQTLPFSGIPQKFYLLEESVSQKLKFDPRVKLDAREQSTARSSERKEDPLRQRLL